MTKFKISEISQFLVNCNLLGLQGHKFHPNACVGAFNQKDKLHRTYNFTFICTDGQKLEEQLTVETNPIINHSLQWSYIARQDLAQLAFEANESGINGQNYRYNP